MARKNVSNATLRNWQRLNSDVENKLQHRANKSRSRKRIFPLEYIQNKDTLIFIEQVLLLAQTKGVSRYDIIYSLAVKLLEKAGIADTRRARLTLLEFSGTLLSEFPALPADEADILGLVYQCLLLEGEKSGFVFRGDYIPGFELLSRSRPDLFTVEFQHRIKTADGTDFQRTGEFRTFFDLNGVDLAVISFG